MSLFSELQRRNVFRVAALYVVGSWLILQIGDLLFDLMGLPDFALRIVLGILLLGFPAALVLAWIYELTPDGVKRDSSIDRTSSIAPETGRKLNVAVLVAVILALVALGLDRMLPEQTGAATEPATGASTASEDEPASGSADGASIAVLPFADLSPEADQRYFADGISEELLNVLAGVEGLTVASRTSSFAYRDQVKNVSEIARELKVGHVLEGSVRKAGNRIRITAQLIDASADRHLWSENYDRDLTDIFAIQDEIATSIVASLQDALGIAEPEAVVEVRADTTNLSAYELYLEGREAFIARDIERRVGITALEQAVALDPAFARAWESLASAWAVSSSWVGGSENDARANARTAARRAIELDGSLSQPYAVLGNIGWEDYANPRSRILDLLEDALVRDPKNTTALLWKGMFLGGMGFNADGQRLVARCLEIDPGYENCRRHLAYLEAGAGDDASAVARFEAGIDRRFAVMDPILVSPILRSGNALAAKLVMSGDWGTDRNPEISPSAASVGDWLRVLRSPDTPLSPAAVARIRAEAERAREITNRVTYSIHWNALLMDTGQWDLVAANLEALLGVWQPARAPYRASAEFKALIRTMGIETYWREVGFPSTCRPLGEDDFACD